MDDFLSDSLLRSCLCATAAAAFRQQLLPPFMTPLSPIISIDDVEVPPDSSADWRMIANVTDQLEGEDLQDDADSSYCVEYNMWAMWQQSGLMPSVHHESNEQMVEERILDTANQGPVTNETCIALIQVSPQSGNQLLLSRSLSPQQHSLPAMDDFLSVAVALMWWYDSLFRSGLYETALVFRQQVPPPSPFMTLNNPLSPIIDDEEVLPDNSADWRMIANVTDQLEGEDLQDDADSSYCDEYKMWVMWQQSGLMPSIHHESNEQMVEELILDTANQGPVTNENCVVKEDCKKCAKECICSQDAYLYDSSTFSLRNEDDKVICGYGYHEALNNDAIQGVTVGGNLVLQTTPNPERLMLSSTLTNIEETYTLGPHYVAQTIPRISEYASNEHGDGGINVPGGNNSDSEIRFPVPLYLKQLPKCSSFWPNNEEGASCSQDAYMHDYSLNGVIVGGKLLPEIISNTENPIMCSPAPNLDLSYSCYSCIPESSGRKRKWFEEFGDGGVFFTRNSHLYGSSSGKGNDDDGVSVGTGSHQNNAYPD